MLQIPLVFRHAPRAKVGVAAAAAKVLIEAIEYQIEHELEFLRVSVARLHRVLADAVTRSFSAKP
jgi:hypothetical protein